MAVYNFDTTQNPPATPWATQSNVSSNGTAWSLAASVSASMETGFIYPVGGENEVEVQAVMNMPTTTASYCGITIVGNVVGSIGINTHWERQGYYDVNIDGGTYEVNTTIASLTDLTLRVITNKFGTSILLNGNCVYTTSNNIFGTSSNVKVQFAKYTEATAGLIKSGYIDSRSVVNPPTPSARSTGILSTLGIGK